MAKRRVQEYDSGYCESQRNAEVANLEDIKNKIQNNINRMEFINSESKKKMKTNYASMITEIDKLINELKIMEFE